jgi:hypothetical protein
MTSMPATASRAAIAPRRRLRLAWVAWRLQRGTLLALGVLSCAVAAWLVISGLHARSVFGALARAHCNGPGPAPRACYGLPTGSATTILGPVLLNGLPVLIGMFVGAPLFARDFESGTQRFAFTQGTSRSRWVVSRLALMAAACMPVAAALGLLSSWWLTPFRGANSPWWPGSYLTTVTPVLLAGWTLLGLMAGAALSMLVRRTVRAIAATGAVLGVLAYQAAVSLRGALLSIDPLVTRTDPGVFSVCGTSCTQSVAPPGQTYGGFAQGGYTVSGWFTGSDGRRLSDAAVNRIVARMPQKIAVSDRAPGWFASHHLSYWLAYQPASRYWLFQWAEFAMLAAVAALLGAGTVALARRRAA